MYQLPYTYVGTYVAQSIGRTIGWWVWWFMTNLPNCKNIFTVIPFVQALYKMPFCYTTYYWHITRVVLKITENNLLKVFI